MLCTAVDVDLQARAFTLDALGWLLFGQALGAVEGDSLAERYATALQQAMLAIQQESAGACMGG